jgi:hypothetical protein
MRHGLVKASAHLTGNWLPYRPFADMQGVVESIVEDLMSLSPKQGPVVRVERFARPRGGSVAKLPFSRYPRSPSCGLSAPLVFIMLW